MFLYCSRLSSCMSLLYSIYVTTKYGNWTLNLRYVRQTLVQAQYCVSLPLEALILSFWPFYCLFLFLFSSLYSVLVVPFTRYYYLLLNRLQTSTFNAWAFKKSTQLSLFIVVLSLPWVFLSLFSSILVVPLVNYYNWTQMHNHRFQQYTSRYQEQQHNGPIFSTLSLRLPTFPVFLLFCLRGYHGPTTTTES